MVSGARPGRSSARAVLLAAAASATLLFVLLGIDVALGYRELTHPNPGEDVDSVYEPHARLGWAPRPGDSGSHRSPGNFDVVYRIDDEGLRRTWSQGAARRRIFVFGDSFTFGVGVADDDTFASVMARTWLAPDVHVRNAGVAAYGLPQQVQRLAELEDRIEPGDLVLFTPISNDLERTLAEFAYVSRFLFRHFDGERVEVLPDLRDGALVTARLDTPGNRIRALLYNAAYTGPGIQRVRQLLAPPDTLAQAHGLLELARAIATRRGARFVLLFLPTPDECKQGAFRVDVAALRDRAPDLMAAFPHDPGVLDGIRFPRDGHWNERGHALAARLVVEALVREGALAPRDLARTPDWPASEATGSGPEPAMRSRAP